MRAKQISDKSREQTQFCYLPEESFSAENLLVSATIACSVGKHSIELARKNPPGRDSNQAGIALPSEWQWDRHGKV